MFSMDRKSVVTWRLGVTVFVHDGEGRGKQEGRRKLQFLMVVPPDTLLRDLAHLVRERFERFYKDGDLSIHLFRLCPAGYDLDLDFRISDVIQNGDELIALRTDEVDAPWAMVLEVPTQASGRACSLARHVLWSCTGNSAMNVHSSVMNCTSKLTPFISRRDQQRLRRQVKVIKPSDRGCVCAIRSC